MPFQITLPTRHTDTFAATGFVHAGVLFALTELAYAALELAAGFAKPETTVAVQRETHAVYAAPLAWRDGAEITVETTAVDARSFEQEFVIRSAADRHLVARVTHRWAWLDTTTGRGVSIPEEVQAKLLALNAG
ncbi:MAG: acyl-CoA thioesterase [Dehalococcoidia bacterium]